MTVPGATHFDPMFFTTEAIGNAFVGQYYYVLCNSPGLAPKFYNESSILSRPNSDGIMTSVTTLKDIEEKLKSLNFVNSLPQIETVDAQDSYHSGIIVVVTGSLSGTDNVRRKFTQTFFLAPQEKGYFVLNDVYRCVGEAEQLEMYSKPVDCDNESSPTAPLVSTTVLPSVTLVSENVESVALNGEEEACNLLDKEKEPEMIKETFDEQTNTTVQDYKETVNSSDSSGNLKEVKSYASMVKVPKDAASGGSNLRWTPTKTSPRTLGSTNLAVEPTASPLTSDIGPQSTSLKGAKGHSIYIRNLPLDATVVLVSEEFARFGPINDGGVQVKTHKDYGYRYGFVEFQSLDSMQNAVKESPLKIDGRRVVVEEKRSTIRVGSTTGDGERFISERGIFQNSRFRGDGYFGGRGYGRNELRNNGKLTSRPKSNGGRYTEYRYQRVDRS
ncbi:hypothetical protein ACET3Z_020816 [Daucus carota]